MKTFLQHYEELMTREEQGLPLPDGQNIRQVYGVIIDETPIRDVVLGLLTPNIDPVVLLFDQNLALQIKEELLDLTTFTPLWQNLFLLAHEIENDPEMMEYVTKYFNGDRG